MSPKFDRPKFQCARALVLLGLAALSASLGAQVVLRDHESGSSVGNFGFQICSLGDVNGDGRPDYAISSPTETVGGAFYAGRIDVFSGLTGAILYSITGSANERLGESMDGGADLNGDGIRDLVSSYRVGFFGSELRIYSGATGALAATVSLPFGASHQVRFVRSSNLDGLGLAEIVVADGGTGAVSILTPSGGIVATLTTPAGLVAPSAFGAIMGDIDQDGVSDVVVGAGVTGVNSPVACSGATGALIRTFSSPTNLPVGFVSTPGDLDGDTIPDVIFQLAAGPNIGGFAAFSGATGGVIWSRPPEITLQNGWGIPSRHVALNDVNGDGRAELVVAAPAGATWNTGSVILHSGATGERLFAVRGDGPFFASHLGNVGDLDGDGREELVEGNYDLNGATNQLDRASVITFTSTPSTLASAAILGIGCRNPAGPEPLLNVSNQPVLGTSVNLMIRAAPANSTATVVITSDWPSSFPIPGSCITIWPNISLPWTLVNFQTNTFGEFDLTLNLPIDPNLVGARFTLQAAFPPTSTPLPTVTNGLQLLLGL